MYSARGTMTYPADRCKHLEMLLLLMGSILLGIRAGCQETVFSLLLPHVISKQCENYSESEKTGLGGTVRSCPVYAHFGASYTQTIYWRWQYVLDSLSLAQPVPGLSFPTHQIGFLNAQWIPFLFQFKMIFVQLIGHGEYICSYLSKFLFKF